MSVFCKGCKKTKNNEDFGMKNNGSQYKTCVKCRERKQKKPEEIKCCDEEEIRNTFKQLNCKIVYLNELEYMLGLDRASARMVFNKMIILNNLAIVETIKESNFMYILALTTHLGISIDNTVNFNVNLVIYKKHNNKFRVVYNYSDRNIFDGFMKCLKLPNKKMCDICNYKKKCFRQCGKCNNKVCIDCFKNNNNKHINSCPYCRYNMSDRCYESNLVLN